MTKIYVPWVVEKGKEGRARATVYIWGFREEERTPYCVQGGDMGNLDGIGREEVNSLDGGWAIGLGAQQLLSDSEWKVIIAHGGSSSPGLYISRTGVAGAPYSGQKHPGHPASLKGAEDTNRGPIMSHIKHLRKQTKQHTHSVNPWLL